VLPVALDDRSKKDKTILSITTPSSFIAKYTGLIVGGHVTSADETDSLAVEEYCCHVPVPGTNPLIAFDLLSKFVAFTPER